jgi:hypothetical protein
MIRLLVLALMLAFTMPAAAQKGPAAPVQTPDANQQADNLRWLQRYANDRRQYLVDTEAAQPDPVWMMADGIVSITDRDAVFESIKFAYLMWAMAGDARIIQDSIPSWMRNEVPPEQVIWDLMSGDTFIIDGMIANALTRRSAEVRSQVMNSLDANIAAIERRLSAATQGGQSGLPGGDHTVDGWGTTAEGAAVDGRVLRFTPPSDGRIDYYQAPPRFHGDWRSARFLVFDKQSSGGDYSGPRDYPGGHGDVELYNGNMLAYFDIEEHHDQGWRTFRIPLGDGAGWQLSGGAQQLSDVLRNVTRFRIRAEYGAGDDSSAITNIHLE